MYLLLRHDPAAVFLPIFSSDPRVLIVVVALLMATQLVNALMPVVLLGPPDHGRLTWWQRTRFFLAMQPLAIVAPARLADLGAVPLLARHYKPGALASTLVMDRLITVFFLLLLAPLAIRFVWPGSSSLATDLIVAITLLVVGTAPLLLSNRSVRSFVNRHVLRLWPSLLRGFGAHTEALLHASRIRLFANLSLTTLKTLITGATLVLLAGNFDVSLTLLTAIWMVVLVQLATALPVSPQGIGVAEASLVILFSANALPAAGALSVQVTARVLLLTVMGAIYASITAPLLAQRLTEG